jgi:hypothetical protein
MASLKERLDAAGYDTANLDEGAILSKLDAAGYDTSGLGASAPKPDVAKAAMEASDPMTMLKSAAPSNVLGAAGVAAANAPGITSMLVNSLPGIGNPGAIMPAAQNIAQNPSQGLQGARRAIETQGGAQMTPEEQTQSRMGQVAGSAMELAVPGEMAANKIENAVETKRALKTMQDVPTPGATVNSVEAPAAPRIQEATKAAADKLQKSLDFMANKAKAKYQLAQKLFGVKNVQEDLAVRKPEELQDAFKTLLESRKGGTISLGRNPATGIEETQRIPVPGKKDQLAQLWQMDKELSQGINHADPASQQGLYTLQKQLRKEIAELPGGKKLTEMRAEYGEMKGLQNELGPALQDPAKQQVIIDQIAKGEFKGSMSAANAARKAAIERLQKQVGSDVLSGPKNEYAKKATFEAYQKEQAEMEKEFARTMKRKEVQALREANYKAKQAAEDPNLSPKQKMIAALKHLARHYGVHAVGGGAAGAAYTLFK